MKNSADKKPWENISVSDIQPYPANYFKVLLLSYLFTIFLILFKKTTEIYSFNLNGIILFYSIKCLVYGLIGFSLLYLYTQGRPKLILSNFIQVIEIFIPIFLILTPILFLIHGFSIFMILKGLKLIYFKIMLFISFFDVLLFIIATAFGPIYLIVTEHPKAQLHGIIMCILIFLVPFIM